jgi:hypothetical protein
MAVQNLTKGAQQTKGAEAFLALCDLDSPHRDDHLSTTLRRFGFFGTSTEGAMRLLVNHQGIRQAFQKCLTIASMQYDFKLGNVDKIFQLKWDKVCGSSSLLFNIGN